MLLILWVPTVEQVFISTACGLLEVLVVGERPIVILL